jgi:hypothetical protein
MLIRYPLQGVIRTVLLSFLAVVATNLFRVDPAAALSNTFFWEFRWI